MQSHQSPKLKTEEGSNWRSPADILDVHQQLRHEASGLRLQLASKQVRFFFAHFRNQFRRTGLLGIVTL
jgi:hypothetical protein